MAEKIPDRSRRQGEMGGELRLSRSEPAAAAWTVTVPPDVGHRLAVGGAPPTP